MSVKNKINTGNEKKPKVTHDSVSAVKAKSSMPGFPIVGIGASAGGLEALEQFFINMPKSCGMAFVIVQHLDPTHAGIMPELLQRITLMKVYQASDSLKVKPDCVYVIPPNKNLSLLNGKLHLFDPVESRGLRLPVDYFFRSLADDQLQNSIGIILSGMGSDGSLGVKAIKEKNGIVMVQDPASSKFDSMPRNAIDSVIADIIAPPDIMPLKLIDYLKFTPVSTLEPDLDARHKSNLEKIIILLREQTGHDFSLYKKNTLFRRIERRKGIHQIAKINNYVRFLQENPQEVDILFKELLIGVTSFFRDIHVWVKIRDSILPDFLNGLPEGYVLRAWIPGCSTGEEAYSLAIVFKEVTEKIKKHKKLTLQIFATDLDIDAIERARKGFFSSNIAADVSPDRLKKFFVAVDGGYHVNAAIREMIVFAPQNVIKDPPFTKLDFLSCRNMLIYMEQELQKKLISLFSYSLNPGGIMLLGTAETPGVNSGDFIELDTKLKIFKRSSTLPATDLTDFPGTFNQKKHDISVKKTPPKIIENIQTIADQVLLQRFAPASVLVNAKGDILYITGRTGKYLEPTAGKANWNIHAMVRDGLRDVLPGAFRKAKQNFDAVYLYKVKVGTDGGNRYADIIIQQLESPDSIRGMIMVVFNDVTQPVKTGKTGSTSRQRELELELKRSYEELQSTHEEMQTSQEELKSTNEELQSTNEELQSTNEELQTVNIELQSKISDYEKASNDMKNLLNSTEIATLFLDRELNIRRFTDNVTGIFKLRIEDIGRPITDLVSNLKYPEIESHAREVLRTLKYIQTAISTYDGRWFNVKIMPYRTFDDHIDGVVITFNDISAAKEVESALSVYETRFHNLFNKMHEGIIFLNGATGEIVDVNRYFIELSGYSKNQMIGKNIWETALFKDIFKQEIQFPEMQQNDYVRYENIPIETADGRKIIVEFICHAYSVETLKVIQCSIRDNT